MKELADAVGVSKTTVFRWENDEHAPTSEELARLSNQLDVKPATFAKEARIV
jgi:transcriptional regulator with XRE-family HTH domain